MKPSRKSVAQSSSFIRDPGTSTLVCFARIAFRNLVSISEIGSVIAMV
jgi:hypothetical protein